MENLFGERGRDFASKVPLVTLMFWAIKICATTVGETGGDALSMQFNLGYAVSTLIFLAFFVVTVTAQVASNRYHAFLYWAVVVATTTVGTTTSDFMTRTRGLGYLRSSILLFAGVLVVLLVWRLVTGRIRFENITSKTDEVFYWLTILVANTLGTALGDAVADSKLFGYDELGFERGAVIFASLIAVVALCHFLTKIPGALLFWAAYILTRPLGATLGDTLTKSHDEGGLAVNRLVSSLAIAGVMIVAIAITILQPGPQPAAATQMDG